MSEISTHKLLRFKERSEMWSKYCRVKECLHAGAFMSILTLGTHPSILILFCFFKEKLWFVFLWFIKKKRVYEFNTKHIGRDSPVILWLITDLLISSSDAQGSCSQEKFSPVIKRRHRTDTVACFPTLFLLDVKIFIIFFFSKRGKFLGSFLQKQNKKSEHLMKPY